MMVRLLVHLLLLLLPTTDLIVQLLQDVELILLDASGTSTMVPKQCHQLSLLLLLLLLL